MDAGEGTRARTQAIRAPLEQEGTKAVLRAWLKTVGEAVRVGDAVAELETDKVAVEISAESDGVLAEQSVPAGASVAPGAVLGRIRIVTPETIAAGDAPEAEPETRARVASDPALRLSPSVRRLLAESGIGTEGLSGSGRDGRLTRADVVAEIARRAEMPTPVRIAERPDRPNVPPSASRSVPHDGMRRAIAEHMSRSVATAPHVTAVFEADFGAVAADRAARKAEFAARGVALTTTAYLVAACVVAMRAVPEVNSRWHEDALEVFDDVNIGVGTALGEAGLIVPVVHRAQTLSLLGIATRLQDVTERARAGRLEAEDVRGGTFSISNHGVSGSLLAAPIIINQPQSAILGVGRVEKRVVVRDVGGADAIVARPMAYVSLTIDHRALDGARTNAWLTRFVAAIEGWTTSNSEA